MASVALAICLSLALAVCTEALEQQPDRQAHARSPRRREVHDFAELERAQKRRLYPLSDEAVAGAKRSPTLGRRHLRIVEGIGGQVLLCKDSDCTNYVLWRPQRLRYYRTRNYNTRILEGGTQRPLWMAGFEWNSQFRKGTLAGNRRAKFVKVELTGTALKTVKRPTAEWKDLGMDRKGYGQGKYDESKWYEPMSSRETHSSDIEQESALSNFSRLEDVDGTVQLTIEIWLFGGAGETIIMGKPTAVSGGQALVRTTVKWRNNRTRRSLRPTRSDTIDPLLFITSTTKQSNPVDVINKLSTTTTKRPTVTSRDPYAKLPSSICLGFNVRSSGRQHMKIVRLSSKSTQRGCTNGVCAIQIKVPVDVIHIDRGHDTAKPSKLTFVKHRFEPNEIAVSVARSLKASSEVHHASVSSRAYGSYGGFAIDMCTEKRRTATMRFEMLVSIGGTDDDSANGDDESPFVKDEDRAAPKAVTQRPNSAKPPPTRPESTQPTSVASATPSTARTIFKPATAPTAAVSAGAERQHATLFFIAAAIAHFLFTV